MSDPASEACQHLVRSLHWYLKPFDRCIVISHYSICLCFLYNDNECLFCAWFVFIVGLWEFLCILDNRLVVYGLWIFFQLRGLFHHILNSLSWSKSSVLMKPTLSFVSLYALASSVNYKNSCLAQDTEDFFPFLNKSFTVLYFTFKFMIHLI